MYLSVDLLWRGVLALVRGAPPRPPRRAAPARGPPPPPRVVGRALARARPAPPSPACAPGGGRGGAGMEESARWVCVTGAMSALRWGSSWRRSPVARTSTLRRRNSTSGWSCLWPPLGGGRVMGPVLLRPPLAD